MIKFNRVAHPRSARQSGLSLIELLIAMALGVILLLGLIQIFGGVRASFNAADSRSRIQESGRYALEFLRRDARMVGHFGCQNEFYHFPTTINRPVEPGFNGAAASGFYHSLVQFGALSIRDNAPYTTHIHRPIEVYNFNGTSPGDATFTIAENPAPANAVGSWSPALPDTGLANIAARAIPGSDIIVMRYFDESTMTVTGTVNIANGTIPLSAANAATVQRFGIYGMTECNTASMFQVTQVGATSAVAGAGGLNLVRDAANNYFNNAYVNYGEGSMLFRYQMVVYYVGLNANGDPALMRQTLRQTPTAAAQGIQLAPAEEVVEGVEMMQVLVGVSRAGPREDLVDQYMSPATLLAPALTPAALDAALRRIVGLRISLLIRGSARQGTDERARDTTVVGDINVRLPDDDRMRQTYDTTLAIRNRLRT